MSRRPTIPPELNKTRAKRLLTNEQAAAIKARFDTYDSITQIARDYGVKPSMIYNIKNGLTYRDA